MLPVYMKILEHIVFKQLTSVVKPNSLTAKSV